MDSTVRLGFINSYNAGTGMASIYYPDRNHQITGDLPVFSPFGAIQRFNKGDPVYVLHLSNSKETGVVLGGYSVDGDVPAAGISTDGASLTLKDASGSATLGSILQRLKNLEARL